MVLDSLPTELLLHVFSFLSVRDILSLRQTSKILCGVTQERSVWFDALHSHVIDQMAPAHHIGGRDKMSLSSADLEEATIHALKARESWTSDSPQATKHLEVKIATPESRCYARTYAAYFLPGVDNRYLITLTRLELTPREYIIQCWDLQQSHIPHVARYSSTALRGVQVNTEPGHPVVLTITSGVPEIGITTSACGIDFSKDTNDAFHVHQFFESLGLTLKLEGSTFFATDDTNRITAYSVETGGVLYILRVPLVHSDQTIFLEEHRCFSMQIIGDFILTFCQQWTHLYALPPQDLMGLSSDGRAIELDPAAKHRWRFRIDTLKSMPMYPHPLAAQLRPAQSTAASLYPPIYILLRFDSWYPWPVNILHFFILPPNPAFCASSYTRPRPGSPPPAELPYLHTSHPGGPALKPYIADSVPSPIRIFTPSDAVLGRYGTALWLDAQTDLPSQVGDRGQRVAGKVLRYVPPPAEENQEPRHAVNLDVQMNEASADRADAEHSKTTQPSLFHLQEEAENWTRLAVCDDEARIAVCCVDGRVMVYDYT